MINVKLSEGAPTLEEFHKKINETLGWGIQLQNMRAEVEKANADRDQWRAWSIEYPALRSLYESTYATQRTLLSEYALLLRKKHRALLGWRATAIAFAATAASLLGLLLS